MFELPETAVTDIITNASAVIAEFWPLAGLLIGLGVAFIIIEGIFRELDKRR